MIGMRAGVVPLVGRVRERRILAAAMASPEAELIAVYGRRRVGKTFLIRRHFEDVLYFELTGMYGGAFRIQLQHFADALGKATGAAVRAGAPPASWSEAFGMLASAIERSPRRKRKRVVFIDELPWLASQRSGFLPAFEHFWNSWGSRRSDLVVVVCGSAASWMVKHLLHARGGLHNRVTRHLRLEPFSLAETRTFLEARRVAIDDYQILELYMALGGIPHYLKEIERGESAAQCIDRVCFSRTGLLGREFSHVYASLFDDPERHELVVRSLAKRRDGLTRNELLGATGMPSGGGMTEVLEELEASGFIMRTPQFGRGKKDAVYRLADEHSLFHLQWIEKHRGRSEGAWLRIRGSPAWRAWSGYSFEGVCLKHADRLREALGIGGVQTEESTWRHRPGDAEDGAQIDLVIDRKDSSINLCEMKFSEAEFAIDKAYARSLANKRETFRRSTGTRKSLFTTLVTTHGLAPTRHRDVAVDVALDLGALF
jgi:uncharacterized protein